MGSKQPTDHAQHIEPATAAQFLHASEESEVLAWEEVYRGRYMPRRIKGSCKGRALG